jgi:hypothetical protein
MDSPVSTVDRKCRTSSYVSQRSELAEIIEEGEQSYTRSRRSSMVMPMPDGGGHLPMPMPMPMPMPDDFRSRRATISSVVHNVFQRRGSDASSRMSGSSRRRAISKMPKPDLAAILEEDNFSYTRPAGRRFTFAGLRGGMMMNGD